MLALAGIATALATGLGAVPVWLLGESADRLRPALWGVTIGVMGVASVVGLLEPALDTGSTAAVLAGAAVGVAFLLVSRGRLDRRGTKVAGLSGPGVRSSVLVFGVLLVHSLPEGLAIGTAYASDTEGLEPVRDPRDRTPEHPGGHEHRDTDGRRRLRPASASSGRRWRSSAPQPVGRADRLRARRGGGRAAAVLVRLRGGGDAGAGDSEADAQAGAAGGRALALAGTLRGAAR